MTVAAREELFPTPTHVRVLVLAILLVAVDTLPISLLGAGAITIGAEAGFGPTGLGYLSAAFFLTAGVVSAPIGRLVERIGWQRAMRLNLAGTISVLLLMSVAARSLVSMGVLLMVAASFYGFGNPAANSALAQLIDPGRQGIVFGLKHAGIPTSTLLAGLAVPLIILNVGWRWAFVAGAVAALGVYLLIPRSVPSRGETSIVAERSAPLLNARRLKLLALGGIFATVAPAMLGTFTVTAAVDAGITEASAGILLSVGGLITIAARVFSGAIVDRYRLLGFGPMATLLAVGAVAMYLLASSSGALFIVLLLATFATAWGWPGLMTFSVVHANAGSVASSSAIAQAGVFLGAGAAPIALGMIADRVSFQAAWLLVGASLTIATVIVGWLARTLAPANRASGRI